MSSRLPGSQTCCVITRAPRALMFCVVVGSERNGWFKLASRTGSIAEIRPSDRASRTGLFCFDDAGSDDTMPPALGKVLRLKRRSGASCYNRSSLPSRITSPAGPTSRGTLHSAASDSLSTCGTAADTVCLDRLGNLRYDSLQIFRRTDRDFLPKCAARAYNICRRCPPTSDTSDAPSVHVCLPLLQFLPAIPGSSNR
jgi:hypothetical protein